MAAVGMLGERHTTKSHASPNYVGKLSGSQVTALVRAGPAIGPKWLLCRVCFIWQVYAHGKFMVAAEAEGYRAAGLPKNAILLESNYAR